MNKTKVTFEVTIETDCEPHAHVHHATSRVTVTVGGVSAVDTCVGETSLGYVIVRAYHNACVAFASRRLGAS